jgi:hypothetical protein
MAGARLARDGIATGFVLRNAQGISAGGQTAVYEAAKDMPGLRTSATKSNTSSTGRAITVEH